MRFYLLLVLNAWITIAIWELLKHLYGRRQRPYRWKCPDCGFKLQTTNRETFEISKSSHNHISSREYN